MQHEQDNQGPIDWEKEEALLKEEAMEAQKKKKKKENLEIGMDGLRGSKEAQIEDQKLPEAMELQPMFKD